MKYKVYIDGQVGTTGLQLRQKLQNHKEVEILLISEELRKDEAERKRLMNEADVVFLCTSPYFSPKRAIAPIALASSIGISLTSISTEERISSFTIASTSLSSSAVAAAK